MAPDGDGEVGEQTDNGAHFGGCTPAALLDTFDLLVIKLTLAFREPPTRVQFITRPEFCSPCIRG